MLGVRGAVVGVARRVWGPAVTASVLVALVAPAAAALPGAVLVPHGCASAGSAVNAGGSLLAAPAPFFQPVKTLDFASFGEAPGKLRDDATSTCGAAVDQASARARWGSAELPASARVSVRTVKTLD